MAIFKLGNVPTISSTKNLYRFYLQREPDDIGMNNYSDKPAHVTRDAIKSSMEYDILSKTKSFNSILKKKINYTVIKINDRGAEAIKNLQTTLGENFVYHNNIEFIDYTKTDILEFYNSRNIKINWVADIFGSVLSTEYSPGELACAASHIVALEYLINNDLDELIVFEDDVTVTSNFNNILSSCLQDLPKIYDFMADSLIEPSDEELYTVSDSITVNSKYICKSYLQNSHTGFMLYSKKGAKQILDFYRRHGVLCAIDTFLFWLSRRNSLNAYTTFPTNKLLAAHSLYGSIISDRKLILDNK